MPIKTYIYTWAQDGDIATPSDAKIRAGWVPGEQPRHDWTNWTIDAAIGGINEIASERINTTPDLSDPYTVISSELWDTNFGHSSGQNYITTAPTLGLVDLCVISDREQRRRPLLLALDLVNEIFVCNPRTLAIEAASGDLVALGVLPLAAGAAWQSFSMCTDNDFVYVMFFDLTNNVGRVQSYTIAMVAGSLSISKNPSWPDGGILLPGTGASGDHRRGKIINADSTKLACVNTWVSVATAASGAVSILTKSNGAIAASGAGDASAGALPKGEIVSDGTNIFFLTALGGTFRLATATIANPQVGTGGTGFPLDLGASFPSLGAAGKLVVSATRLDYAGTAVTDVVIRSHIAADATCDIIVLGQNSHSTPLTGAYGTMGKPASWVFDGLHFWLQTVPDNLSTSLQLLRIDAAKLTMTGTAGSQHMVSDIADMFYLGQEYLRNPYGDAGRPYMKACFDGRDLWCITPHGGAGTVPVGCILRLPCAAIR